MIDGAVRRGAKHRHAPCPPALPDFVIPEG